MSKIINIKRTLIVGLLAGVCVSFTTGCKQFTKYDEGITYKKVEFTNLSDEFVCDTTSMRLYFQNNGNVPYVSVNAFLSNLDGVIDTSVFRYKFNYFSNCMELHRYYSEDSYASIKFDWKNNVISGSNYCCSGVLKSTWQTNYSSFIKNVDHYYYGSSQCTYNLDSYYFDILVLEDKCLIPLVIANILFCSQNHYNVFYNGDKLYGYYGEISSYDAEYEMIRNSSLNGKDIPNDVKKATVNSFLFAMDYFYGLKEQKDIDKFKNYIYDKNLSNLWSTDPTITHQAFCDIIYNQLDELHSRVNIPSMYASRDINVDINRGSRTSRYYDRYYTQRELRQNAFPNGVPPVRYYGDTAIITFNSFVTAPSSSIYEYDGSIKSDAWKQDSYFFMRHCMEEISYHSEIKDVVIDLSLNGGGNIGAMIRVLGFLTDKIINYSTHDMLTGEYYISKYKIDTDGDGFYDNDAYDQYNWNVLVGENTFSAANAFTSNVLEQNLATVIGQRSGGGMCSVMSIVLADGTGISISSNNSIRYVVEEDDKLMFYGIESGLKPNKTLDYEYFYNDSAIAELIG
ncbi:MAG: hypothetical protein IJ247_00685 [Bacilli bacterium]|nr:hypothetical protein [Bacilli bacterium]